MRRDPSIIAPVPGAYRPIYLDFNASTPVAPEVIDAMRIVLEEPYGNPSSGHWAGSPAKPLDEALLGTRARGVEMLALDEALSSLSNIDLRKGRVVELRYFGGLTVEETAEVLQISPETVLRDWKMAKTWLFRELTSKRILSPR